MPAIESTMLPLGTIAPQFTLLNVVDNKYYSLHDLCGAKATVVMFICNHCPFVIHVKKELARIATEYKKLGIAFIAISANDISNYPDDAPDKMQIFCAELDNPFPYLYDETQQIAKKYQAACTPDFFVFDASMHCVYRGQMDGSRPGNNVPVSGQDLRSALDSILQDKPIALEQKPSLGCSIKWKK